MNINSRYHRIYYGPDAGGPGGAPNQQGVVQQQQVGQQQTITGDAQQDDKPKTPEEMMKAWGDLWNPKAPDQIQQHQQQVQNNQQQQVQPSDRLQNFLKEQKYFDGVDQAKFAEALRTGDPAQIMPQMQQMFTNMHTIMLANMDKFGEHYYTKAVKDATSQIGSSINFDKIHDRIFKDNPALNMPAIAPMVKATVKQLVAKGADADKAVKETLEFFSAMGNSINKPPPNLGGRPGSFTPSVARDSAGNKQDYDALWADKEINF